MKRVAKNILWIFLLFLPVFYALDLNTMVYLLMAGGIWTLLWLNYPVSGNRRWYRQAVTAFFCNLLTFAIAKYLRGYRLVFDLEDILCIFCGFTMVVFGFVLYSRRERSRGEKSGAEELREVLFPERKFDRERLLEYLKKFPVVGINGAWGSGKSFVTDRIDDDSYLMVKIDLLACNVDDIQTVLLNELDKILKEHGIFSPFSPKLKKLLQQERILQNLGQIFVRDDISYSDAIEGFRDSLGQIKQTIVIVYEDLDRIEKQEVIQRVMGISEKIAGKNVKVIYQYDEKNLQAKNFERSYLEKYIPYTMNLTDIPFPGILDYLFALEKYRGLSVGRSDFDFLNLPVYMPFSVGGRFSAAAIPFELPDVTIRKTEHFLSEIDNFLKKDHVYEENKREVILFFLIKHFYYEIYQMLVPGQGLLETFQFHHEEKTDTIGNWIRRCKMEGKNVADIFLAEENREPSLMISLFQYECDVNEVEKNLEEIVNESVQNIRKKNTNEQKDRIIWNLLCSGKSEFTNRRAMVERLYREVLAAPREQQIEKFEKLCNDVYYGRIRETEKRDNGTIFLIGIPGMVSLFQANRVAGRTGEQWIAFVDFYLRYKKIEWIEPELIECLNYCELSERKLYLFIVKTFNKMKIGRNLNSHKAYHTFLDIYLSALSSLGFVDTEEVWAIRNSDSEKIDIHMIEEAVFKRLIRKLESLKQKILIETVRDDIDALLEFLDKNQELMHAEGEFPRPEVRVKSSMSSKTKNQESVDQLNQSEMDDEAFQKYVQQLYEDGNLTAYEIAGLKRSEVSDRYKMMPGSNSP